MGCQELAINPHNWMSGVLEDPSCWPRGRLLIWARESELWGRVQPGARKGLLWKLSHSELWVSSAKQENPHLTRLPEVV